MQVREKVGKSRNTVFFQWFVAPEGRKVGWEMKNCTPLWREAHFEVKMYKAHQVQATFGSWDVEKVRAVVAQSRFANEKTKSTSRSDQFWKLRCRKSARRCGAKHICKWKSSKHLAIGPLLEVEMSKKCRPLWREAHFEVKMYKTLQLRTSFGSWDVEKVHAVVARSTFRSQNFKTPGVGPLLDVQMSFRVTGARDCALVKSEQNVKICSIFNYNHHYTTRHYNYNYTFTTFHYTTLHSTTLHYTQLHSITVNYITLHSTPLHCTALHYTTLHSATLHYMTLDYTTFHSTTLHSTTLHYTQLHYTTLHYTTLHFHYTTLHLQLQRYYTYTTLHYTTLHYTTLNDTELQLQLQL